MLDWVWLAKSNIRSIITTLTEKKAAVGESVLW